MSLSPRVPLHLNQRERSCFMRSANSDEELDIRIYAMGEFGKINNVAKRLSMQCISQALTLIYLHTGAKRIGLLFSGASLDYILDPRQTLDIPDITVGEDVFSDGCGLIAKGLAMQLAKMKGIKFRNRRYTPTVFQIRFFLAYRVHCSEFKRF